MKYISFDLETTGLVRDPNNILQIAAVVEDTDNPEVPVEELPYFTCFVKHESYTGSAFALNLNAWILGHICNPTTSPYPIYPLEQALEELKVFIDAHFEKPPFMAGVNAGIFDYQFLPPYAQAWFKRRLIEAGSVMLDWNFGPRIFSPECDHDALNDARFVIEKLRETY